MAEEERDMVSSEASATEAAFRLSQESVADMELSEVAVCGDGEPTEIIISVRRDFPIREGERLGGWRWSRCVATEGGGSIRGEAQTEHPRLSWSYDGDESCPAPDAPLVASAERPVVQHGIDIQGQSTDHHEPISGLVRLQAGSTSRIAALDGSPNGLAAITTTGLSGRYEVTVFPEYHNCDDPAGPTLNTCRNPTQQASGEIAFRTVPLHQATYVYRPFSVAIELRNGRIVSVDDPYDPPSILSSNIGATHGRVGNHYAEEPKTDLLPISLKPIWWKHAAFRGLASYARPASRDVDMVIVHCTGGSKIGRAMSEWDRRWSQGTRSGAQYLIDIDGHIVKLMYDEEEVGSVGGTLDLWSDPPSTTPINSALLRLVWARCLPPLI